MTEKTFDEMVDRLVEGPASDALYDEALEWCGRVFEQHPLKVSALMEIAACLPNLSFRRFLQISRDRRNDPDVSDFLNFLKGHLIYGDVEKRAILIPSHFDLAFAALKQRGIAIEKSREVGLKRKGVDVDAILWED